MRIFHLVRHRKIPVKHKLRIQLTIAVSILAISILALLGIFVRFYLFDKKKRGLERRKATLFDKMFVVENFIKEVQEKKQENSLITSRELINDSRACARTDLLSNENPSKQLTGDTRKKESIAENNIILQNYEAV